MAKAEQAAQSLRIHRLTADEAGSKALRTCGKKYVLQRAAERNDPFSKWNLGMLVMCSYDGNGNERCTLRLFTRIPQLFGRRRRITFHQCGGKRLSQICTCGVRELDETPRQNQAMIRGLRCSIEQLADL